MLVLRPQYYLLPEEAFSITLTVEGVHDFFCVPHEHAGMGGRIIVGDPMRSPARVPSSHRSEPIPEIAQRAFPSVGEIMRRGAVQRTSWSREFRKPLLSCSIQ